MKLSMILTFNNKNNFYKANHIGYLLDLSENSEGNRGFSPSELAASN